MYRVLIVDDELLIRTTLKYMLDWEAIGFTLSGEAANGREALEFIKKSTPDIILLDMRMPVMDGLQLSYELKKDYPDVQMIILSNYDDFEYVKNTLKNGAVDYILKHNLNEDTLRDALLRAKAVLENSKASRDRVLDVVPNNLAAFKENLVIQLLTGQFRSEEEVEKIFDALQIKLDTKNVVFIEIAIDHYRSVVGDGDLKAASFLEFALVNVSEDILKKYGNGLVTHISNEKFALILSFAQYRSSLKIDERIKEILQSISTSLYELLNITVSFSVGTMCDSILTISESYRKAEENLKNRFYTGKGSIITSNEIKSNCTDSAGLSIETEKKLITCLKLQQKDKLMELLKGLFEFIKKEKISLSGSQMIFFDLIGIISKICKENHIPLSTVYSSSETPHKLMAELETLDEIESWFINIFINIYNALHGTDDVASSESEYVRQALTIIRNHYSENISLSYVARQINISSTYLSTLFKEETGEGFAQYLIRYRIEKAKALLREENIDIKEIVKLCGFSDYGYFFRIFKKKVGMTPMEYAALCRT
ncbi:MAG TPA: response regulator [Clostridiaceae bacterium]|nr:response regulator [Clostridiaceae bacterium]